MRWVGLVTACLPEPVHLSPSSVLCQHPRTPHCLHHRPTWVSQLLGCLTSSLLLLVSDLFLTSRKVVASRMDPLIPSNPSESPRLRPVPGYHRLASRSPEQQQDTVHAQGCHSCLGLGDFRMPISGPPWHCLPSGILRYGWGLAGPAGVWIAMTQMAPTQE